jgi:hypothetical protein
LEFPFIHTNFWDALIAIPAIVVAIEFLKIFFRNMSTWIPVIANVIGIMFSVFLAHPESLWTGIVMGIIYGVSAVGSYATFTTTIRTYRDKRPKTVYK